MTHCPDPDCVICDAFTTKRDRKRLDALSRPERLTRAYHRLLFAELHGKPETKRALRKQADHVVSLIGKARDDLRLAREIFGERITE